MKAIETAKEKIARLRADNLAYARFTLWDDTEIRFTETTNNKIAMQYIISGNTREIQSFTSVPEKNIQVSNIGENWNIFLSLWKQSYIFDTNSVRLYSLPFEVAVSYIKPDSVVGNYLVVTEKGTFHYNIADDTAVFEYLFRDFVYEGDTTIGIIYKDEIQKKSNFDIEQKWNLIVQYNPDSKERKILLSTDLSIDKIQKIWDKIIFSSGKKQYELLNY